VRVVAPSTLLPSGIADMGVEVSASMAEGLKDADVVMMLRLQRERMAGAFVPSVREYFRYFGLDAEKLKAAKPDALVMHPGPMNRGVEIASEIADGPQSVIQEQVEMGVAVRMAVMEALLDPRRNAGGPPREHHRLHRRPHRRPVARHRRDRHGHRRRRQDRAAGAGALNQGAPEGARSSTAPARRSSPAWSTAASSSASPAPSIARRIASASLAAAAGGVTSIVMMPDTDPVIDDIALVEFVLRTARDTAIVNVHPAAAITKGLAGREMTEFGLLREAGAVAFTDGRHTIAKPGHAPRADLCARFRRGDRP
jgi:hypothetical protein